jgi:toxin ParE1/3/4
MWTLRWTIPAVHALEAAHAYYHELNPQAANRLAQRIVDSAAMLAQQPAIGRPGLRPGTREWVVSGTPYILFNAAYANEIRLRRDFSERR